MLTNQHWVIIDNIDQTKAVYIFRSNGDLLISVNGKVDKGSWAYLGNNSLLIEKSDGRYLFKHGFFDENVLALKVDSSNEYVVMVNENKFEGEVKSMKAIVQFLERRYLDAQTVASITGVQNDNSVHVIDYQDNLQGLGSFAFIVLIIVCMILGLMYFRTVI